MKKDKKALRWLYGEIPELVAKGILSEDAASKLKEYYGEVKNADPLRVVVAIFAVIGALLIGGGIILIIAHNWSNISRPVRAALAFVPLIGAQIIAAYALLKRYESVAWKEGAGIFLMLSLGAAIALVGQTYHVSGDMESFLFSWLLTALPLVYVLGSAGVALLYLAGTAWWCGSAAGMDGHPVLFWFFFLLVFPYIIRIVRADRFSPRSILLLWGVAITLPISVGIVSGASRGYVSEASMFTFSMSGLLAVFYLLGKMAEDENRRLSLIRPLYAVGALGVVVVAAIFTFSESCGVFDLAFRRSWAANNEPWYYVTLSQPIALTALAVGVFIIAALKRRGAALLFGALPLLVVLNSVVCTWTKSHTIAMIAFNVYMAALGIATIVSGVKRNRLGRMNAGMAVLSILILMRFFDANMNILLRGIAFVVIGVGFLGVNLLIVRKRRAGDAKEAEGGA